MVLLRLNIVAVTAAALLAAEAWCASTIEIEVDRPGKISLGIYDGATQLRTLISGQQMAAGAHSVTWDGLDRSGTPVPPGEYEWRMIRHDGIKAEYLLSLGTSVGHRAWPGQHGGPTCLAVRDDALFLSASMSEGSPQAVKVALDADLRGAETEGYHWAMPTLGGWHQGADITVMADRVYFISARHYNDKRDERHLFVRDAATGEAVARFGQPELPYSPPPLKEKDAAPSEWDEQIDGADSTLPELKPELPTEPPPDTVRLDRVDAAAGVLLAASTKGVVGRLDSKDGKVLWSVQLEPDLKDIAVGSNGRMLVLYPEKILQLKALPAEDVEEKAVVKAEVFVDGLTDAACLDIDLEAGDIVVSEHGRSQRVKKFSSDGEFIAAYGRKGGREYGRYVPANFLNVEDIAADGNGGFVVAENTPPRRTAHFDGAGMLIKEWYGGQQFYTYAAPDPADPTSVWMDTQWGHIMNVKVDYETGTWKVRAVYVWPGDFDGDGDVDRDDKFYARGYKMATRHFMLRLDLDGDGEKELYVRSQTHGGFLARPDEERGILRGVALYSAILADHGWNWPKVPADKYPKPYLDALAEKGITPEKEWQKRKFWNHFTWADADGDYGVDADELRLHFIGGRGGPPGTGRCLMMDEELNTYVAKGKRWRKIPVVERSATGAPVWDLDKAQDAPAAYQVGSIKDLQVWKDSIYAVAHTEGDGYRIGGVHSRGHGWTWPGTQVAGSGVFRWNASDNSLLFRGGRHAARHPEHELEGQLHYPVQILGPVKGVIGVADKIVHPCELWTTDGLYVGGVMDDRVEDNLPAGVYAWWRADLAKGEGAENKALHQYDMILGGSLFELQNGDLIWFGAGWNNVPVYRIHGVDTIERRKGTVTLNERAEGALAPGRGLQAKYVLGEDLKGKTLRQDVDPQIWFGEHGVGRTIRKEWPELHTPKATADELLEEGDMMAIMEGENKEDGLVQDESLNPELHERNDFPETFTVVWTGFVAPRFTEKYVFSLYYQNAELWLDGNKIELHDTSGRGHKFFTDPISMTAGAKVPIRLVWTATEGFESEAHLNWESPTQQVEHVPQSALYPTKGNEKGATVQ